jgi:hypothetical protein
MPLLNVPMLEYTLEFLSANNVEQIWCAASAGQRTPSAPAPRPHRQQPCLLEPRPLQPNVRPTGLTGRRARARRIVCCRHGAMIEEYIRLSPWGAKKRPAIQCIIADVRAHARSRLRCRADLTGRAGCAKRGRRSEARGDHGASAPGAAVLTRSLARLRPAGDHQGQGGLHPRERRRRQQHEAGARHQGPQVRAESPTLRATARPSCRAAQGAREGEPQEHPHHADEAGASWAPRSPHGRRLRRGAGS